MASNKEINKSYIQSPLNYTGGKYKLLPQITKHFPNNIDIFVDLFCGGGNVGVNIPAKIHYYNDINTEVIGLLRLFKEVSFTTIIMEIEKLISKFNLSDSMNMGYVYYDCSSQTGLSKYNKDGYIRLRSYFNNLKVKDSNYYIILFLLIIFSFNNQIRFNKKGEYNLSVGKRDFNLRMRDKLKSFSKKIQEQNTFLSSISYDIVNLDILTENSFIYIDPPYLISTATYNEQGGWCESNEIRLLDYISGLNIKGYKFALSNVLRHKGKTNKILSDWICENPSYNVIYLNSSYSNCNYQTDKENTKSDEILVFNYEKC